MAVSLENSPEGGGGGIFLSLDSQKSVPAPFLIKTYQLVDDPQTEHIVSWGQNNTTFVVWRPSEFARDLLPNYFKHNNFSSFVRQLNTYGFRKIVPDRWEFANEYFKRGEKQLLCEIHRRKTSPPPLVFSGAQSCNFFPAFRVFESQPDSDETGDSPTPDSCSSPYYAAVLADNERLRQSNAMLVSELTHMKKLYNDIIYFVQNHVKPVAPSHSYPYSKREGHDLWDNTAAAQPKSVAASQNFTAVRLLENDTKLFGVMLRSNKRLHANARLAPELEDHDLRLNLMPPKP